MTHVMRQKQDWGKQAGEALSETLLPRMQEQRQYNLKKSRLNEALSGLEDLKNNPNATEFDVLNNLTRAMVMSPEAARGLEGLATPYLQQIQRGREQKFNEERRTGRREGGQAIQEGQGSMAPVSAGVTPQAPGRGASQSPGIPSSSHIPQKAAPKQKEQERTSEEIDQDAEDRAIALKIPFEKARQEEESRELYKREQNQRIDAELEKEVAKQNLYGDKGEEKLVAAFPESTDEMKALSRKWGEEAAQQNMSEADIDKHLATKAKEFKKTLARIEKTLPAPRSYSKAGREVMGTTREFEKLAKDYQVKLKPLLDLGLYDTARKMLEKQDFWPEEREMILYPEQYKKNKIVDEIPKIDIKKLSVFDPKASNMTFEDIDREILERKDEAAENLVPNLRKVFSQDPDVNLILLRKQYEDRGYDWTVFKDALNDLILGKEVGLSDEQSNQLHYLDQPPLDNLDKIWHFFKFIGR